MRFHAGGLILILLGVLLLLQNLGLFSWESLWKFWPVVLIGAGLSLLFPQQNSR
ncbi:MAG: LiaI-LiaF-like domain-containing protein [Bacillota bacterium]